MACTAPMQEWTIHTLIDGQPESQRATVVFCISIDGGIIKGEVSEMKSGEAVPLSPVTGTIQPIPEWEQGFEQPPTLMILSFNWGSSKIMLSGNTFRAGGQNNFRGRFSAFKLASVNGGSAPVFTETGPGDGDTGTGAGTQT